MAGSLPKANLRREISNDIFTIFDCRQLAVLLSIDDDIVTVQEQKTPDPHAIAFHVLKTWSREEDANGRTLYGALNNKPFKHLARKYKEDLLGTGVCSASGKRKSRDVHCDKEGQPETRTFSDVSSGAKKRKSKDVHSDEESRPKKRKSSGMSPASGKRKSKDADSAKKRESSGDTEASSSAHSSSSQEAEWRKVKLTDERSPLFWKLADSSLPFSTKWEDIFKCLPDVGKEGDGSQKKCRLQYAYRNPQPVIDNLKSNVRQQGSTDFNSDCLQKALGSWLDDKGGQATIGHLWDVLNSVKLGSAADEFFHKYFSDE